MYDKNLNQNITAKEYLDQIRFLDHKVTNKIAERDHIRDMLCSISGDGFSERVQTSPCNQLENGIARIDELNHEADRLMYEYMEVSANIINQINSLENKIYADLLHKRYVQFMKLGKIANCMGYTYDRTRHLHGEALRMFAEKYL